MRTSLHNVFALAALLGASAAFAADSSVRVLASECMSCHGLDGRSAGAIPSLAGMTRARFIERMQAFKAKDPSASVMNRIAPGFSDAQIGQLAEYFAEQRP